MAVEQAHLTDGRRADEVRMRVDLRAGFQARAAGHTLGEFIRLLPVALGDARAGAEVIRAVNRDPAPDFLEVLKHPRAVHGEVLDDRELGHRLQRDGLWQVVHQRRTALADLAVHQHGAGAADVFEAVHFPHRGRGLLAVAGHGVLTNLHQARDDVHRGPPRKLELFPVRGRVLVFLALDFQKDTFLVRHGSCLSNGLFE